MAPGGGLGNGACTAVGAGKGEGTGECRGTGSLTWDCRFRAKLEGGPRAGPGTGVGLAGTGAGVIAGATWGLLICSFGFTPGVWGVSEGDGIPGAGMEGVGEQEFAG